MPTTKGHWAKGKRRNIPRGWSLLQERLREVIKHRLSARQVASRIGVSDRTLRRWLSNEDNPTEDNAEQIRAMLRLMK